MENIFDAAKDFEIIDFHTHPFWSAESNICAYKDSFDMRSSDIKAEMNSFGISRIAGSVLFKDKERFSSPLEKIRESNRMSLKLREELSDFYVPGFHIHPDYVEESIGEIRYMASRGVYLIGELVPYMDSWEAYDASGIFPILDEAEKYGMTVSFHTMASETIDAMVASHPNVNFVAAHPGERESLLLHVERMKRYPNLYLDISGTGIFRYHAIKYLVSEVGSERVLFGTDYPICNPGVYVGGLLCEGFSESELENIFSNNAKRLLRLK